MNRKWQRIAMIAIAMIGLIVSSVACDDDDTAVDTLNDAHDAGDTAETGLHGICCAAANMSGQTSDCGTPCAFEN